MTDIMNDRYIHPQNAINLFYLWSLLLTVPRQERWNICIFFFISKILVRPRPRSSSLLRKSTLRSPRSSLMSLMSTLWSPSLHYGHWGLPILIRINPVTLIHTPHCPLTRKIKNIFFNFENIYMVQACNSNLCFSLSPDKKGKIYFFNFENIG